MGFFEVFAAVLAWFYALVPSYGLAIILLTLAVRVLLLPLSIKSTRSMREMQVIQPEVKKLQKKYKNDRQKMNTELMALYKEHGVNPFGGCLPLLLQMPVFFALFYVVRSPLKYLSENVTLYADLDRASTVLDTHRFLGLRLDCSPAEAYAGDPSAVIADLACSSGGLLGALPYFLVILLMGATTYYQQRQMLSSRGQADPQAQQMQNIMKFMPIILVVFGFGFPMGVVLYWVTTNAWTIVQQRIMLRAAPPIEIGAGAKQGEKPTKAATTGADKRASKKTPAKPGSASAGKKGPDKKTPSGASPGAKGGSKKRKR
ncbi:MAG: YidC/Oxa1 family membrane protein insertase [Actinomycetota bacterium]|nr:YidC/Oxa1 family membrane protein insertase [Actinomycetota bacterium]